MANNGVVVEKGDNWIIVLFSNGKYKKIKTNKYFEVGDLYKGKLSSPIKYTAAAAVFFLILVGSLDFFNVTAYATVSSGIELGVNRWNRVVTVKTASPDNNLLLNSIDLRGKKAEDALDIILEESTNKVEAETNHNISVEFSGKNKAKLEKKLADHINQFNKQKRENRAAQNNPKEDSGNNNISKNSSLKSNNLNNKENGNLILKKESSPKRPNNNDRFKASEKNEKTKDNQKKTEKKPSQKQSKPKKDWTDKNKDRDNIEKANDNSKNTKVPANKEHKDKGQPFTNKK